MGQGDHYWTKMGPVDQNGTILGTGDHNGSQGGRDHNGSQRPKSVPGTKMGLRDLNGTAKVTREEQFCFQKSIQMLSHFKILYQKSGIDIHCNLRTFKHLNKI